MLQRIGTVLLLTTLGCSGGPAGSGAGPVVAEANGLRLTAGEVLARLDEQPPSIRQTFNTLERRRQFVEKLASVELVARAAEREGLAADPDVQRALKRALLDKHYQRFLAQGPASAGDAEIRDYYDRHRSEYSRPGRVHLFHLFLEADEASPVRARKGAQARALLGRILAEEKKSPEALSEAARRSSEDAQSRPVGGDLGLQTREQLEVYGKEVAAAAFALAAGETSPSVVETSRGFHLLRVTERMPEMTRSLADLGPQIGKRLALERREREYEALVKKLLDDAQLRIDEPALEKLTVAAAPGGNG